MLFVFWGDAGNPQLLFMPQKLSMSLEKNGSLMKALTCFLFVSAPLRPENGEKYLTKGGTNKKRSSGNQTMILPNPCLPSYEYPLHDSDTVGGSEIQLTSFSHYLQGFHTCWVVQKFFHRQYCSDFKFLPDKICTSSESQLSL